MQNIYEERVRRVLDYIHSHPTGDLSLGALADVAAMSRFHWHRVFHGMTGETCAQAVRRIRLHRAACWLVHGTDRVDVIATRAGFSTRESFARAFKSAYGQPPASFRNRGDLVPYMLRKSKEDFTMFDVTLRTAPSHRLAAMAHSGPYLEIGHAFEQIQAVATARRLWPHTKGMLGIYYDDPNAVAADELRSHAALMLDDQAQVPDTLEEMQTAGGRVAVLLFRGPYAGLKSAYDYLFGEWLPASGEEPRDAPTMEIYLNNPTDTDPNDLVTEIYLPLR